MVSFREVGVLGGKRGGLRLWGLSAVGEVLSGVVATSIRILRVSSLRPSLGTSSGRPSTGRTSGTTSQGTSTSTSSQSTTSQSSTSNSLGQQTQSGGSFSGTSEEFLDGEDDSQNQSNLGDDQSLECNQSDSSEEQGQQGEQLSSDSQDEWAQDLLQLLTCNENVRANRERDAPR